LDELEPLVISNQEKNYTTQTDLLKLETWSG